jgi:hypothetical protein
MMLALLLARMGVDVFVLEKHADFLRDFRGDTIHPSTLEIMHELGILDEFLKRPHQEIRELAGQVGKDMVTMGISRIFRRTVASLCCHSSLRRHWRYGQGSCVDSSPREGGPRLPGPALQVRRHPSENHRPRKVP